MNRKIIVDEEKYLISCAVSLWDQSRRAALAERDVFTAALSGGKTPSGLYMQLARRLDPGAWEKTHIFQVDERHVPGDHPDSNWAMIHESLVEEAVIADSNLHGIIFHQTLEETVRAYAEDLARFFAFASGEFPIFDFLLLGIGSDGHTASLFPGGPELEETAMPVTGVALGEPRHDRITLTLPVLQAARRVVFLALGEGKAQAMESIFSTEGTSPAGKIEAGETIFLCDPAAAGRLAPEVLKACRP